MTAADKVGFEFPRFSMTVELGKIKEFVLAIGDDNPIYTDVVAARQAGFNDITVPPTFMEVLDMWNGPNFMHICQHLGLNPVMVLHGEQEYKYLADIYPGDVITGQCRVVDGVTKKGSSGGMHILQLETTYNNHYGTKVAIGRSKVIERF